MADEIERKFLIEELPEDLDYSIGQIIHQGYFTDEDASPELRVRSKGENYYLTAKSRGTAVLRDEGEIEITQEQYEILWPFTEGKRLEKIRYNYPVGNYIFEIDIYQGVLEPLKTVDIEFPSLQDCEEFSPPDFLGKEISGNPVYKNIRLSLHGLPDFL